MSGAEDKHSAMETGNESHSGGESPHSPIIQLSATAKKRDKTRQNKQRTLEHQDEAIRSARATYRARTGETSSRARSRSSSPDSNSNSPAKKKGRKKIALSGIIVVRRQVGAKL